MKNRSLSRILLLVLFMECLGLSAWVVVQRGAALSEFEVELRSVRVAYASARDDLIGKLELTEYLATGDTPFERVFNTENQSIINMLTALGEESFPESWVCSTEVEEFTHFLLTVQTNVDIDQSIAVAALRRIGPLLKYGGEYLGGVALFDRKHICRFAFDAEMLIRSQSLQGLSDADYQSAANRASKLTRFDSHRVPFEERDGHMYVSVDVQGDRGIVECNMMLDTGASVSMLPREVFAMTGDADVTFVRRQTFQTANGEVTLPMLDRTLRIGMLERIGPVAMSERNTQPLLGMDFFSGREFVVDTAAGMIYVWQK